MPNECIFTASSFLFRFSQKLLTWVCMADSMIVISEADCILQENIASYEGAEDQSNPVQHKQVLLCVIAFYFAVHQEVSFGLFSY